MREQDFIEMMMMLESRKKQIRDNSPKPLSESDEAIIQYTDTLIFELLEKQHQSLITPPTGYLARDMNKVPTTQKPDSFPPGFQR